MDLKIKKKLNFNNKQIEERANNFKEQKQREFFEHFLPYKTKKQ